MSARIGIGIDTGGTYTDAVVYDFSEKKILGGAKALTTKYDLSVGILEALDGLPADLVRAAGILSLSTTLATNACVEDKGGSAKLIFLGGEPKTIDEFGAEYGLPSSGDIYMQDSYTSFYGSVEREPDWDLFCNQVKDGFDHLDGAGIIEMNASRNGAVVEKQAKELFQKIFDIPVVCGHELFSELNCLQRGASTLLNARLFPVIKEFLDAIKTAMRKRDIHASVVIVRSDGSLMSDQFACEHPVETLLCGPAASVMGAAGLVGDKNSIVVDMGGTTTDIALVKDGTPVKACGGVSIGKWKTFVQGLYINTFGLGGDSAVHFGEHGLFLEEYRVVPLCVASSKYPAMIDKLQELCSTVIRHTRYLHEFYMLVKDISGNPRYTDFEQAFCAALRDCPLIAREAAAAVGTDIYTLDVSRLLHDGIVHLCGLTPTDVMHLKKDFSKYDDRASRLGARYIASNLGISVEELCDAVYDEVKKKLYRNIVKVLLQNESQDYLQKGVPTEVERLIDESYDIAKTTCGDSLLSIRFHTDFTLVGIGAPIRIFLEDVSKILSTKTAIPKYYEVANALGTVVGKVYADYSVEIRPLTDPNGITGYAILGDTQAFETLEEARSFAESIARANARTKAVQRGAVDDIHISCGAHNQEAHTGGGTLFLGSTVTAHAVGSI